MNRLWSLIYPIISLLYLIHLPSDIKYFHISSSTFAGSLNQIDSRTPPRTLNVRQYATEEQWEREATSGTRDQRVSSIDT